MVACWIRRLHLIQSLASAWGWAKLSPVHLTTISFFSLPFPLRLVGWPWKRPRDSSSLWWSIRLYSHLSDQSFFCALSHSWRSRCRKYEADVWSLSSLHFSIRLWSLACSIPWFTCMQEKRRGHETISVDSFFMVSFLSLQNRVQLCHCGCCQRNSGLDLSWLMLAPRDSNCFTVYSCWLLTLIGIIGLYL